MAHSKSRSKKPATLPTAPKANAGKAEASIATTAEDTAAPEAAAEASAQAAAEFEQGGPNGNPGLETGQETATAMETETETPADPITSDSFETNPAAGLDNEKAPAESGPDEPSAAEVASREFGGATSAADDGGNGQGLDDIPEAVPVRAKLPVRPHPVQPPGSSAASSSSPIPDIKKPAPRAAAADSFEQNPLAGLRPTQLDEEERLALDDGTRLREALRSVIQDGDSLKEAAKDWNVTPSSIAEWRSRYQDLLQQDSPATLLEVGHGPKDADLTHIPDAAREIFTENWDRLVTETAATPRDFKQRRSQIFLQTSPLTAWLFQDGELDRGNLAGLFSVLVAIAIVSSFLIADRNPAISVPLPEPPPRDDLVIEEASKVAESFLKAPNWQERLKFVRHPEAVKDMMEDYYKDHPDGPMNDATLSLAMPARNLVNLSYDIPSQGRSHFLCVVKSKGRHVVDWESSSIHQEARIAKLRQEKSTQPTRIAVTLTKSEDIDYYNYAFRDATKWVCYKLGYPGLNINLFGYAQRDSSDAIALDAMLEIVSQHAVVMEVRFPPDSPVDNQVEIISVLRNEWVPDEP